MKKLIDILVTTLWIMAIIILYVSIAISEAIPSHKRPLLPE